MIANILRDFSRRWRALVLTDIVYKLIATVLLGPLLAILFRVFVSVSGKTLLADLDFLFFFLHPLGWLCLVVVGAVGLAVVALEMASLMGIMVGNAGELGVWGALRFAWVKSSVVLRLAARVVAYVLLVTAPFLAVMAAAYLLLLTEFDINYYLAEKPPAFLAAVGIGVVALLTLAALLLRLFTSWFFALPLVLFEEVPPSNALRKSRERALGKRLKLLAWIVGWGMTVVLSSAVVTGMVVAVGSFLVPRATGSLQLLLITIGLFLLTWFVSNLALNLLGTTFLAAMHICLYQQLGGGDHLGSSVVETNSSPSPSAFRMTTRRLLAVAGGGFVVALAIGLFALHGVRLDDDVEIIAHRGSSQSAPENTLAAVRQAIEDETDWVEIDVQETADDEVVVFHDSDFMKLSGVKLKIWDATMADLKDIDIGSWFDPQFENERVPTLRQVLETCQEKAGVTIELKYYGHDRQLEQRVARIVEETQMTDNIVAMSLKLEAVRKMKKLRPQWRVGLLMSVAKGDLAKLEADFLAINAAFATRSVIREAHQSGKAVFVWTVNDAVSMSQMISRGVDGLITDKPALARSVLQQRSALSPPERLLLELAIFFGVTPKFVEQ